MKAMTLLMGARGFSGAGFALPRLPVMKWLRVAAERRRLAELPEHALHDIGVSRDAAASEAARPFWDVSARR